MTFLHCSQETNLVGPGWDPGEDLGFEGGWTGNTQAVRPGLRARWALPARNMGCRLPGSTPRKAGPSRPWLQRITESPLAALAF